MTFTNSLSTHRNILSHPFLESCLHPVSSKLSNSLQQVITFSQNQSCNPTSKDPIRHLSPFFPFVTSAESTCFSYFTFFLCIPRQFKTQLNLPISSILITLIIIRSPSWFSCIPGSKLIDPWKGCPWRSNRFPKTHLSYWALPVGSCLADPWKIKAHSLATRALSRC